MPSELRSEAEYSVCCDHFVGYEKELGWKAEVSLEEGLEKTVEFFRKLA